MAMAAATRAPKVLVTPSVHYAVLSEVSPLLGVRETMKVASFLKQDFSAREGYIDLMALAEHSDTKRVETEGVEATLLLAFKGRNTACVIYPAVALEFQSGMVVEISAGTQIPTKRFMDGYHKGTQAKNWASVHVRCGYSDGLEQMTTGLDKLPEVLATYRNVAKSVARREFARMSSAKKQLTPDYKGTTESGTLTMTTLGVRDKRLEQLFEAVGAGTELEKIFAQPKDQELLFSYLRAAGLDASINMENARRMGMWFTMYGRVAEGMRICEAPVLYFATQKGKEIRVVGIGHDSLDGPYGRLARDASSKVQSFMHKKL